MGGIGGGMGLVEEEMMIVGTVQQEEDCSWQDTSKSWMEQDEEVAAGIYQVGRARAQTGRRLEQGRRQSGSPLRASARR
jgi:hypothetical protein